MHSAQIEKFTRGTKTSIFMMEQHKKGWRNQGGILAGKGTIILSKSFEPSGKNHALLSQFCDLTKKHRILSRFYIRRMKYCKNILPWNENCGRNFFHVKKFFYLRKKFPTTGKEFMSHEDISSDRTKFQVTKRNFLSQKEHGL